MVTNALFLDIALVRGVVVKFDRLKLVTAVRQNWPPESDAKHIRVEVHMVSILHHT